MLQNILCVGLLQSEREGGTEDPDGGTEDPDGGSN